jgi:hypothetical protein
MPRKIISKITSSADKVRHIIAEETFPEAVRKAKAAGASVADGVGKAQKATGTAINDTVEKIKPVIAGAKKDAETIVTTGIRQVSEIEWKKEFEKFKALELPLVTSLKPIDWSAEHIRFWGEEKNDAEVEIFDWISSDEPHHLVAGPPWGWTTVNHEDGTTTMVQYKDENGFINQDDSEQSKLVPGVPPGFTTLDLPSGKTVFVQYQESQESEQNQNVAPGLLVTGKPGRGKGSIAQQKISASEDEIVYTSVSEPRTGNTDGSVLAHFLEESEKKALLSKLSADLNEVLVKEEDKLSFEDSKQKGSAPVKKKTAKTVVNSNPVVTVLGSDEGQVAPLGTEYKKLIRKVAKQADKNPDVKLYLAGKTYGIGARGTVENIDGDDVNVFNAKDIKKLLAKIS